MVLAPPGLIFPLGLFQAKQKSHTLPAGQPGRVPPSPTRWSSSHKKSPLPKRTPPRRRRVFSGWFPNPEQRVVALCHLPTSSKGMWSPSRPKDLLDTSVRRVKDTMSWGSLSFPNVDGLFCSSAFGDNAER